MAAGSDIRTCLHVAWQGGGPAVSGNEDIEAMPTGDIAKIMPVTAFDGHPHRLWPVTRRPRHIQRDRTAAGRL